jgi:hypothetical protein
MKRRTWKSRRIDLTRVKGVCIAISHLPRIEYKIIRENASEGSSMDSRLQERRLKKDQAAVLHLWHLPT